MEDYVPNFLKLTELLSISQEEAEDDVESINFFSALQGVA